MWFVGPTWRLNRAGYSLMSKVSMGNMHISTGSADPRLVILNPREAGLVRAKPRRPLKKRNNKPHSPVQIQTTPLDALDGSGIQSEPVVSAIHSQRPESTGITHQRFEQIRDELARGFKKSQLEDYLKAQKVNPTLFKRLTKPKMAQFIMSSVWNCFVRDETQQSGGGVFTENILELSEQDMVLVLGSNGRLLREWSKSGAKIAISPYRFQIIVNSTQETFDWINASLSHFLESVITTEIDITNLKQLVNLQRFPEHLSAIQQLTDTYFSNTDILDDSIVVSSASFNKFTNTKVVKRLLGHLAEPAIINTWKPASWWFDINIASQSKTNLQPFSDTDSMEWMERMRQWSRWENVKTKVSQDTERLDEESTCRLRKLVSPEFYFSEAEADVTETKGAAPDLASQLEKIAAELIQKHPIPSALNNETVGTTLTVTPGYLLHEFDSNAIVPNAGMPKTFCSNIPFAANLASTLPLFSKDIKHEDIDDDGSTDMREAHIAEDIGNSTWEEILNLDAETDNDGRKVFATRRKELDLPSNMRLIQMKFIADPHQGLTTKYPPLEAWVELPPFSESNNSLLQQVPRLFAVPTEASSHVSLPGHNADLKMTLAHTYPINITPEIERYFMKQCRFGRLGPIEIKPDFNVELGGESVTYSYHSAAYVTLAELDFRNHLLQLSQIEGGKLGGRKIEASLVEHSENAADLDATDSLKKSVRTALSFIQKM